MTARGTTITWSPRRRGRSVPLVVRQADGPAVPAPPRPARTRRAPAGTSPPRSRADRPTDEKSALVLALTGQIAHLKKQHREVVQALRDDLELAHGESLGRPTRTRPPGRRRHPTAAPGHRSVLTTTYRSKNRAALHQRHQSVLELLRQPPVRAGSRPRGRAGSRAVRGARRIHPHDLPAVPVEVEETA